MVIKLLPGNRTPPFILIMIKFLIASLFFTTSVLADYYVTGKVTGGTKEWGGFKSRIVNVDAVMEDGKLYEVGKQYPTVTEYDKNKGRCWLKVGGGVTGVLQMFSGRSWHTLQADGTYKKIKNLEYLTFPCVKK